MEDQDLLIAQVYVDDIIFGSINEKIDNIERKSTSGACQFLGQALISWSCRK
jgi:tetrahydromethanopterin S-methyltransferase subunit G